MQRSYRILLVSFVGASRGTGMGRWTHAIMDALREQGHRPSAWFADDFPLSRSLGRFAVLVFPLVLAARLIRSRGQFDVVAAHEPSAFWYGLLRKLARSLTPLIVVCHNVESHHFRRMLHYGRLGLARVPLLSRLTVPLIRSWQSDGAIQLADHVVCLSSADEAYIVNRLGVPRSRVSQLVNGTASDDFGMQRAARRRHAVLSVGGWIDVKGRRVLPVVWRLVRVQVPDAVLTLVGTGTPESGVLGAFPSQDRSSITVMPSVEDAAMLKRLYAEHAAFLSCSLSEGSPLAVLEAMAARLPVVATAVGGVPDLVRDGLQALLFDPAEATAGADAVARVLTNPSEATRLARAAEQRAAELSWRTTANGVIRAVSQIA